MFANIPTIQMIPFSSWEALGDKLHCIAWCAFNQHIVQTETLHREEKSEATPMLDVWSVWYSLNNSLLSTMTRTFPNRHLMEVLRYFLDSSEATSEVIRWGQREFSSLFLYPIPCATYAMMETRCSINTFATGALPPEGLQSVFPYVYHHSRMGRGRCGYWESNYCDDFLVVHIGEGCRWLRERYLFLFLLVFWGIFERVGSVRYSRMFAMFANIPQGQHESWSKDDVNMVYISMISIAGSSMRCRS